MATFVRMPERADGAQPLPSDDGDERGVAMSSLRGSPDADEGLEAGLVDVDGVAAAAQQRRRASERDNRVRAALCAGLAAVVVIALVIVSNQARDPHTDDEPGEPDEPNAAARTLFADYWQQRMDGNPPLASYMGDQKYDDRLQDLSPAARAERAKAAGKLLSRANSLHRESEDSLLDSERVDLAALRWTLENEVEAAEFGYDDLMPINQMWGPQLDLADTFALMPVRTAVEVDRFEKRLGAVPAYLDQMRENLAEGLRRGITPPKAVLGPVLGQFDALLGAAPEDTGFYKPFRDAAAGTEGAKRRDAVLQRVKDTVLPKVRELRGYWEEKYYPGARDTVGATSLPNGKAYYEFLIRQETTVDSFPPPLFAGNGSGVVVRPDGEGAANYLHALGLAEVERISHEMRGAARAAGFNDTVPLSSVFDSMRENPALFAKTGDELLAHVRDICKRADAQLPKLFRRLPRCPYGVEAIPADSEKDAAAGYYMQPDATCTRSGTYAVNTYKANTSRPLYVQESTSLHESVPGHHLQIALALEREGAPAFRLDSVYTAYVEGWALYAESLGGVMGFYKDPFTKLGALGDEMLRACRLVVDTGLHARDWTITRAVTFMLERMPLSEVDIRSEVNRYAAWPGQALAYKTGQLTISAMRRKHADADIRDFHEAVLGHGALPLPVLERQVEAELRRA